MANINIHVINVPPPVLSSNPDPSSIPANTMTTGSTTIVKTSGGTFLGVLSTKVFIGIAAVCSIIIIAAVVGATVSSSNASSSSSSVDTISTSVTIVSLALGWNPSLQLNATVALQLRCTVANISGGSSTIVTGWIETVNDALVTITEDHPLNSRDCDALSGNNRRRLFSSYYPPPTNNNDDHHQGRQLPSYIYPVNPKSLSIDTVIPVTKKTMVIQRVQTEAQSPSSPLANLQTCTSTGALVTPSPSPTASASPVTSASLIINYALKTGISNGVSGAILHQAFFDELKRVKDTSSSILNSIYGTLSGITWDPSHDSIQLKITDSSNVYPLIIGNKDYKGADSSIVTLGVAGFTPSGKARFIALGGIPFGFSGFTGSSLEIFMRRSIAWLMKVTNNNIKGSIVPGNLQRITVAHLPGDLSYWFKYDKPTTNWLNKTYPGVSISVMNSCEYLNLASCLTNPAFIPSRHLLVLGPQIYKNHDNVNWGADITDGTPVVHAVKQFLESGGSLLYLHYDGTDTVINIPLFEYLGLGSSTDNYWKQAGLLNADISTVTNQMGNNDLGAMVSSTLDTLTGKTPLTVNDLTDCAGIVNTWTSCTNTGFKNKVAKGAIALRDTIRNIDERGIDLFNKTGSNLLKILVLLGDKYRANTTSSQEPGIIGLKYPMLTTDYQRIAAAAFADSSVLYRRNNAPPQDDLGSLYCPRPMVQAGTCRKNNYDYHAWQSTVPLYTNEPLTIEVPFGDTWTTTGLFALPGKTVQVQRIYDSNVPSVLNTYVRFFFQREAVTKALESTKVLSNYDRPQFTQSHTILVPNDNSVINITAPYGGPIYIAFKNVNNARTAYIGNTFPSIVFKFSNVAKHSSVLDIANYQQITAFTNTLLTNPIPFVDLKADGFEVHARKDHITNSLKVFDYEGHISNYTGPEGAKLLMKDYRDAFVNRVFTLAGLKIPGKSLNASLPTEVQSICTNFGLPCTDDKLHRPTAIQHSNYDQDAACGWGCSGNPWDAGWDIVPTGWGESHELGHNLQKSKLNIHYVPSSYGPNAAKDKNLWSSYSNRAGENSNNIFPYHTIWAYRRIDFKEDTLLKDGHMDHFDVFAAIQSAKKRIIRNNQLLVLKPDCTVWKTFPSTTPSNTAAFETIYWDSAYAADNSPRMSFYLQLPLVLAGKTMRDGTVLHNGFNIFTLIYSSIRYFENNLNDDASWKNVRDKLGFSLFNRTGHTAYGTGNINGIPGNDYLVIVLSRISGYDFRPYFDIRGIPYTDLANNQINDLITKRIVNQGSISTDFYLLEDDFPPLNFTNGKVPTVKLDGTSSWTKTGSTRQNWNPANCAV